LTNKNDPKSLAIFINCLSVLEDETARLYKKLSAKVEHPLFKSLLFSIAQDSTKHGALLKGVADSVMTISGKPKNLEKLGDSWHVVASLNKQIESKKIFSDEDFVELSWKLAYLESSVGEEYYMFVQLKTLERMMREINQIYRIDLGSVKKLFTHIINDEERHREIIETIRATLEKKQEAEESKKIVTPPLVKYTSPDNWIAPFSQSNSP
jgi:rubrerythrin